MKFMKALACVFALFASAAFAGTDINLPSPFVFNYYTNPYCNYNPPAWTSASGFTADGNYLNGISSGYVACGSLRAWQQPALQGQTWTNAAGYEAYTVTNVYYGYISSRYAVLVTP